MGFAIYAVSFNECMAVLEFQFDFNNYNVYVLLSYYSKVWV